MIVRLKRLDASAHLPDYAHDNDAGCDLYLGVRLALARS